MISVFFKGKKNLILTFIIWGRRLTIPTFIIATKPTNKQKLQGNSLTVHYFLTTNH